MYVIRDQVDLDPVILVLIINLDVIKMYLHTKIEVSVSTDSQPKETHRYTDTQRYTQTQTHRLYKNIK